MLRGFLKAARIVSLRATRRIIKALSDEDSQIFARSSIIAYMGAIIAVDIGGTQIRAAAYPRDDVKPVTRQHTSTKSGDGTIFDRMTALIASVWQEDRVDAISVAIAGPLDPLTGTIIEAPNIPGWKNFPLGEKLTERFHVPVFIGNDANLAAVGEWRYGAGQGHHDLLYLTISTGIGGGVIINDRLLLGAHGLAAELGHVTVDPDGPLCSCGQRGHLEAIASGPAIVHYVSEKLAGSQPSVLRPGASLTARDVAEAARQGDELAKAAFVRAGESLGQAVADFLHIFNPTIVILGGGVSQSGPLLLEPVKDSMKRHVMDSSYLEGLELAIAKLGDNAGLLGALALARIKLAER
jgi:glucokinase